MSVEREKKRYALCYRKKPLKLEFLFKKKNHLTHLRKTTLKYLVDYNLLWFENGN